MPPPQVLPPFTFTALTPDRWPDLEALFSPRGAVGGCWCMWWRLPSREFGEKQGAGCRQAFQQVVESGPPPGILAYDGDRPVGWCAFAPRSEYPRLNRSRTLKPVDEQPVWAVTCFFIAKGYRRRGLSERLLAEAVAYMRTQGAAIIEGYPLDVESANYPDTFAYTGYLSTFTQLGFEECARRSEKRPIVRLYLDKPD